MMRILLIYPDIHTIQFYHFQHGLAWISAVLKKAGHNVGLLYINAEPGETELVESVKKFKPDLVGISSTTLQYQFTRRYAKAIRENLKLPLVLGGIHATIATEEVLNEGLFDFLVRCEGEYPLLELAEALHAGKDFRAIKNLAWRENGENRINPVREPVDLDLLLPPDRELFDEDRLLAENDGQFTMMASRGCIFACSYCCNTVLTELAGGVKKWHRYRRVESVIDEIELAKQRRPDIKSIIFFDEVFTANRKWIREFCREYIKRGINIPYQVYLRVGTVDFDTLKLMRESGLYSILIGVESGDERVRREVLNRRMPDQKIIDIFKWSDQLGIITWSLNMIGVPGDTEESLRKTIELNTRLVPSHLQLAVYQPFPGTPLYERCVKEGLILEGEATAVLLNQPRLNLPGLSRERIGQIYDEFLAKGWQWEAIKGSQGYFDLSASFEQAGVQAGGENFVKLWLVRVLGEDRLSILIHPPSRVTWKMKLKPGSKLRFGASFSPDVWDKPGAGCHYLVKVKTRFGGEETVFSKYLDPKHDPAQRKWTDFEVDLAKFKDKKIELVLETATDGPNDWAVAFWSRPHLVAGGE
jgi:anaerobic magnesium-protoporphyrin IX monomethyl ester cyclase